MGDYYWKLKVSTGRKYDPGQPRVPAGSSEGGRWTAGGVIRPGEVWPGIRDLTDEEKERMIAEDAADFLLNHRVGDKPGPLIDRYLDQLILGDRYETFHDWAIDTLARIRPENLYEQGKSFMEPKDLENLRNLPPETWRTKKWLQLVSPQQMPDLDRVSLESEYGISRYAIFPDIKPVGTWEFRGGMFVISIDRTASDKRRIFWHEIGHILPGNVIDEMIGPARQNETAAEFTDRFAEVMVS